MNVDEIHQPFFLDTNIFVCIRNLIWASAGILIQWLMSPVQ
jgi:hypothetical protein